MKFGLSNIVRFQLALVILVQEKKKLNLIHDVLLEIWQRVPSSPL